MCVLGMTDCKLSLAYDERTQSTFFWSYPLAQICLSNNKAYCEREQSLALTVKDSNLGMFHFFCSLNLNLHMKITMSTYQTLCYKATSQNKMIDKLSCSNARYECRRALLLFSLGVTR